MPTGEMSGTTVPIAGAVASGGCSGRTRRMHFVGIGGIGMSGIAELLANLGYEVSGSDARTSDVTVRLAELGVDVRRRPRSVARGSGRRGSDVVGDPAGQPGDRRSTAPSRAGDSAGRDARGADAPALRHRDRRRARQDHDDVDGGAGAGTRRPGPDRGDWRPAQRVRQQRQARAGRLDRGRGRRERSIVPDAVPGDRARDQHRSRAHGGVRQLGRAPGRLRGVRQQGSVLRRGGAVRGRSGGSRAAAADHAPGDHLRPARRSATARRPTSPRTTCTSSRSAHAAR